ncbi:MAG: hypothetical protein OEO23_16555, partial [Gemmatimonadota bacterium]|nr:hypothetical protein [Gemmatimonadota bacterium]
RRRIRQSGGRCTAWLVSQLVAGCLPWILFRVSGAGILRYSALLVAAGSSVFLWMAVFNHTPVIDLVRSLPVRSRAPVAAGLNLFSVAWAGALLGWKRGGTGPLSILCAVVGGWAVWQAMGLAPLGSAVLWGGQAVACLILAWAWVPRPSFPASRPPRSGV